MEAFCIWKKTDSHFFNRVLKEYFLYDFNIGFIYIIFGMPSLAFGIVYGTMELIYAASTNLPTQLEPDYNVVYHSRFSANFTSH
jgi:hypothetical protein